MTVTSEPTINSSNKNKSLSVLISEIRLSNPSKSLKTSIPTFAILFTGFKIQVGSG